MIPKLMVVTSSEDSLQQLTLACQSGIPALQLRVKGGATRDLLHLAVLLREITAKEGTFFTINERLDIALAVHADGIHLPEDGLPPWVVKKVNPKCIVGVSVHSLQAGLRAENEGADYVIFGPIFSTLSKISYGEPQGINKLEQMARTLSIPVIAIGGITLLQVHSCIEAGAHGVAAIGAFSQAKDLQNTVKTFLGELYED